MCFDIMFESEDNTYLLLLGPHAGTAKTWARVMMAPGLKQLNICRA